MTGTSSHLLHNGAYPIMSRFVLILIPVALLLPSLALAKRLAPANVKPVVYQGVRYIAPNDDGRRAYIEARDVQTDKELWDLTQSSRRTFSGFLSRS